MLNSRQLKRVCWMRLAGHALAICVALLIVGTCSPAFAQSTRRVALLIGNETYRHERPLKNPVNDARLLGRVLKENLQFDDVRVERNLDVDGLDRVIAEFVKRAEGADTVVFYYSGHGMKSPDRRNFLLPIDARTGTDNARPLDRQAVSAEDIRDKLRAVRARVTLLILDACRDGPGGGKSGNKGLTRMGGGNQVLIAYATEEDRVAADGAGSNSPYAEALAKVLSRNDMPLLQQLDWVSDEVRRQVPGQEPTREGNLRADAYLASPFRHTTPQEAMRIEDVAWTLCRESSIADPCDGYLKNWPQGRYADLARNRLRELQQPVLERARAAPAAVSLRAGQVFRDCAGCPEMVVVVGGSFLMGSPPNEPERDGNEGPQRVVTVNSFAAGKMEVTFAQWDLCQSAGGCQHRPGDEGWGRGSRPVMNVSWDDAQEYARWLSKKTGKQYRLLSESEWEYAARGGTSTAFHTGDRLSSDQANFDGKSRSRYNGSTNGLRRGRTTEAGQFGANRFGLHDVHGNVWEWVEDCHSSEAYQGKAPSDGRAHERSECSSQVVRGGSWDDPPGYARSASRGLNSPVIRTFIVGFRLGRSLP